jgi:hypothetical protein
MVRGGVWAVVLSLSACGTNATGIEECRQIELARCHSAAQCGLIEDVAACERYIADECRHGLPPDLGPSSSNVTSCVKAINDVASCAKRSGNKTAPSDCGRASLESANADNVCDLVEHPEEIPRCSFLAEPSKSDEADENDEDEDVADAASKPETPQEPAATPTADAAADASP